MQEDVFKILLLGGGNACKAGKTSLRLRFIYNTFSTKIFNTVGVEFGQKVLSFEDDQAKQHTARLQMWDIAGSQSKNYLTKIYYTESTAAVIVFDITQPSSLLEDAKAWLTDLKAKLKLAVPVILLANKVDLNPSFQITEEDREKINQWCQDNKLSWFAVSAAQDQGEGDSVTVAEAFTILSSEVVRWQSTLHV